MKFCNRDEAVKRMNRWGKSGIPFFFLISFDGTECLVLSQDEMKEQKDLLYDFPMGSNANESFRTDTPFQWEVYPESFASYREAFEVVRRNLYAGNSFLVNLTCRTAVKTDLSLRELFERSEAPYKVWLKGHFTCFSPETFVRIQDGFICSFPMKGTMDASVPNAYSLLLNDPKEAAEHATITDLIRNDLSQVASEVAVVRYKYIDRVSTHRGALLQMSSEIRGKLSDGFLENLGDLFFRLLPAGSITGAPKTKTVEIINEAEKSPRGFYTGVMGYFDGSNLDSAVMIRFVEEDMYGNKFFRSGGGITFQSDARSEYEEMKAKIYVPIY